MQYPRGSYVGGHQSVHDQACKTRQHTQIAEMQAELVKLHRRVVHALGSTRLLGLDRRWSLLFLTDWNLLALPARIDPGLRTEGGAFYIHHCGDLATADPRNAWKRTSVKIWHDTQRTRRPSGKHRRVLGEYINVLGR